MNAMFHPKKYECNAPFTSLVANFRLLVSGDSVVLLFAPYQTVQSCTESLVSPDAGVILSAEGVAPYFQSGKSGGTNVFKLPAAVIFACSDR